jgi:histidyl-tRNA synthetase
MKKADASRARYAVIIGDDEAALQQVTLKPLRGTAEQTRVEVTLAIEYLKKA